MKQKKKIINLTNSVNPPKSVNPASSVNLTGPTIPTSLVMPAKAGIHKNQNKKTTFYHNKIKRNMVNLGDVAQIISGQSPKGQFYNDKKKGIPFYQGKKEFGEIYLKNPAKWTISVTKTTKPNDILMSVRAPVGPVNITLQKICIGRGLASIRGIESKINQMFLFHYLKHNQDKFIGGGGSIFDSISQEAIKAIKIPLPPLTEQKKIADILSTWDQAIEKTEKLIRVKKKQFQWLLYQLIYNYKKPKWPMIELGKVCKLYQPKTISKKEMIENGKYVVFGANGIIGRYNKYNHKDSEVLITCRGASCGTVNLSKPKSWVTGNAMVAQPLNNKINKKYLFYSLKQIDFYSVISGAAQPQITRQKLLPLKISLPPLTEQKKIVDILSTWDQAIDKLKQISEKYQEQKKGLMQELLMG